VPSRSKSTKTQTRATSGKRKHTSDSASAPATKKVNRCATVEEVEDEDAPPIVSHLSLPSILEVLTSHHKRKNNSDPPHGSNTKKATRSSVEEVDDEDDTPTKSVIVSIPHIPFISSHLNKAICRPVIPFTSSTRL
jgi:hypothetical protein